jgi:hypothetical protein
MEALGGYAVRQLQPDNDSFDGDAPEPAMLLVNRGWTHR